MEVIALYSILKLIAILLFGIFCLGSFNGIYWLLLKFRELYRKENENEGKMG